MADQLALVPQACTLSSADRPRRVAQFDALFATALRELHRPVATRLRLILDPAAAVTARELADRETACCSFFTFTIASAQDGLHVDVVVPAAQVEVLDALVERAVAAGRAAT